MQVFIVGSPLETARVLDKKRLHRQIQEVKVILAALNGAKAWSTHPCILQYRGYENWLEDYMDCLKSFQKGDIVLARVYSFLCRMSRPDFHCEKYFTSMKRRLYTKDPVHYAQWSALGTSDDNYYFVDGSWRIYRNGKLIQQ